MGTFSLNIVETGVLPVSRKWPPVTDETGQIKGWPGR
nr:MAG TPA: hypothetical protein [Caudoviricetes sp.]